ncbi:hypothetical protein E4U22_000507 [Claviceps purpurea]|nr:hypothetical protein E4U22_000507 [Claviceps purpurea]
MSRLISSFRFVPIQLFRVKAGKKIRLRDYAARKGKSFDVVSENGLIKPKALDPSSYTAPNGASMRPLVPRQKRLVREFLGTNVVDYAIDEGMSSVVLVRPGVYASDLSKNRPRDYIA